MLNRACELISDIVESVGPRLACSEDEKNSAEWMAEKLRENGCETEVKDFHSVPSFTITFGLLAVAGVGAYFKQVPVIGFLVSLVMIAEVLSFYTLSALLSWFWRSCNAEGFNKAARTAKKTIVLIAHIDSAIESGVKTAGSSRLLLVLMIVAPTLINIGTLGRIYGMNEALVEILRAPGALFLLACAGILARQLFIGEVVPGAADNASGMAALVIAAQRIPRLQNSDLWMVGTGSEESGLFGIVSFLRRHRLNRKNTWIINLDQLGRGPLSAITVGGMLIPLKAAPELVNVAKEAAAKEAIDLQFRKFRDMSTDACPCVIRGYKAISLMGAMDHWHQKSDGVEEVDSQIATNAGIVAAEMVIAIDEMA